MTRIFATPRLAAVLALVLALVACSANPPADSPRDSSSGSAPAEASSAASAASSGGGQQVDACALLSDAEVQQATSFPVVSKEAGPQFGIYSEGCDWKLDSGDEIVTPEVTLGLISSGGRDYFARYDEPYIGDGFSGLIEEVSGIGDIAVREEAGAMMAVQGDVLVDLQYVGPGPDDDLAEALIKIVLSHL